MSTSHAPDTTRVSFDPIMILIRCQSHYALWQVETDPQAELDDFSGAWLIGPDGIRGFAHTAPWLDYPQDTSRILRTLVRYPTACFCVEQDNNRLSWMQADTSSHARELILGCPRETIATMINIDATDQKIQEKQEETKKQLLQLFPQKKQPHWPHVPLLGHMLATTQTTHVGNPLGLNDCERHVVCCALTAAHHIRLWIRAWIRWDKTRLRYMRTGQHHDTAQPWPIPLVCL